ncbi:MAG: universal stress protein [Candidatus Methanoperedens sp.]|nr:universal stress protein [Candidatus Methanoperedens sp.]
MMSKIYKKILIATDGSEHVKKAVTYAIELAKLSGAELHAVYVISLVSPSINLDIEADYDSKSYNSADITIEGLKRILKREGDAAIKYIEDLAKGEGLDVVKWIVEGLPAEEILKLAEEQSIDLIVMGTLGRSGIEKFLLGSVADKVIRGSGIPVLTVRN